MGFIDIEEIILNLADLVYEVRRLRKENAELKKLQEKQRKQTQEMVDTNLKNTANFLEILSNKGE